MPASDQALFHGEGAMQSVAGLKLCRGKGVMKREKGPGAW